MKKSKKLRRVMHKENRMLNTRMMEDKDIKEYNKLIKEIRRR
jgi:hypothetical protein